MLADILYMTANIENYDFPIRIESAEGKKLLLSCKYLLVEPYFNLDTLHTMKKVIENAIEVCKAYNVTKNGIEVDVDVDVDTNGIKSYSI